MRFLLRLPPYVAVAGISSTVIFACTLIVRSNPSGKLLAQETASIANTAAAAVYVGKQVCGECHQENYQAHAKHGHAGTFFDVSQTELPDIFASQSIDGGESFGVYQYALGSNHSLNVQVQGADQDAVLPLQYALGSGHNAQTFLTLFLSEDGSTRGLEHRISCYHGGTQLGLTVGHLKKSVDTPMEIYGDEIEPSTLQRCIYCHTTTAQVRSGAITNLVANVNCEKCHGPGSEHVRLARESPTPPPYSVGQATWDSESELQLCGDCHRLPRSLSKKELREYPNTLTRFQPVGMLMSNCYLKSNRQLRCTTCHDPHGSVHQLDEVQKIEACRDCHGESNPGHVPCPVNNQSGCIECHMPAIDQSQGIKFHDHWIRVR